MKQLNMFVREVPASELLDARTKDAGFSNLKTSELIAMITKDKEPDVVAMERAEQLLILVNDNLNKLNTLSEFDFYNIGYSKSQMNRLLASMQLSFRPAGEQNKDTIFSPEDIAFEVRKRILTDEVEHFFVILLDTKNRIIKVELVTKGILDASLVHPREIFKSAVRNNACSIAIAHNHPSGDVTPSSHDIQITKTIVEAGKILFIEVVDHVVVGRDKFLSMREKRLI